MNNTLRTLVAATLAVTAVTASWACTNLIVGKNASADGSTIITYAADSHTLYGDLRIQPAADHRPGEMRKIYDWDTGLYHGEIPEVPHTYQVVGNINEHQVTIGESTWGGRHELEAYTKDDIMDYGSLIYVTLQRAKTAREALTIMTDLIDKYGYNSEGESFSIGDPNEVWVMDVVSKGDKEKGAVWVAIRIPDDCIAGHANQARIHKFPLKDKQNCIYSKDVISFARKMGYFNGKDEDFDFQKAYAPADFGALRGCDARVWSYFNRFASGMDKYLPYINGKRGAEIMPLYVKPDHKISVREMQEMMRDHFEGTPFDMTQDPGAKMWYDVPYRWRPMSFTVDSVEYTQERAIATQQTGWVYVSQMRSWLPNPIGGVLWFGVDDANTAVFVPMYCCLKEAPKSYAPETADLYTLNWESAFWVNNFVANQAYNRYNQMIGDIRKVQRGIEDAWHNNQAAIEKQALALYNANPAEAVKFLNEYSTNQAQDATARYRKLGEYLLVKYLDGNIKKEKNGEFERNEAGQPVQPTFGGYNQEYFDAVARGSGDRLKVVEPEE